MPTSFNFGHDHPIPLSFFFGRFMRDDQEAGNDGEEGIIKKKKMIISLHYLVEVV